jgi:hypothetical protein
LWLSTLLRLSTFRRCLIQEVLTLSSCCTLSFSLTDTPMATSVDRTPETICRSWGTIHDFSCPWDFYSPEILFSQYLPWCISFFGFCFVKPKFAGSLDMEREGVSCVLLELLHAKEVYYVSY